MADLDAASPKARVAAWAGSPEGQKAIARAAREAEAAIDTLRKAIRITPRDWHQPVDF